MAQRRMLSKSISTSKKLSKVDLLDALVFTWLIPHCDDFGRMDADPAMVKGIVLPVRSETVEQIAISLKNLNNIGLIKIYNVNGEEFLEIEKWEEHQTFKTDRGRMIKYPFPEQDGNHRIPNGNHRIPLSNEVKLSEVKSSTKNGAAHKNIFEFYVLEVKKQYGISPAINGGKDGHMVQSALKKHGEEKTKKIIEYYLQSDKAKKIGYDLSTALSAHSINMYLKDNEALI